MKLLKNIKNIFKKKYEPFIMPDKNSDTNFKNIYKFIEAYPEEKSKFIRQKNDTYFNEKYKNNITKGYYGFSTNSYMPENWSNIIDDLVELFITNDPNFEIHQIKIKFGGIRFYVRSKVIDDLFEIENYIAEKLYSPYLIY